MHHSLRVFSLWLALIVSAASTVLQPSTSFAEELKGAGLGLEMLERLTWTKLGADGIPRNLDLVEWEDEYCIPPDVPNKEQEEQFLKGMEKTLQAYIDRYNDLRPKFLTLFANDGKARNAVLAKLPKEANPMDNSFWQPWQDSFRKARQAIKAKRDELAKKPVKPCRVAPEPPPPPPPPSTDPGVPLPKVEVRPVEIPPTPGRFCSEAEKQAALRALRAVAFDFYLNYQDARNFYDAIKDALDDGKGDARVLGAMLPKAKANLDLHTKRLDDFHKELDRVAAMAVVDCGGSQPQPPPVDEGRQVQQPSYEHAAPMQTPDRFCSEAEKQALLDKVLANKEAARRNYEKAKAFAEDLQQRIKGGDRSKWLGDAHLEASRAATRYYNLWIELDRVYYKAQAMPVVDCRQSGVAPGAAAGASAGAQTGAREIGMGAGDPALGAHAAAAFGTQHLPTFVYLGFENAALVQTFAVENLDDNEQFTAFDGEITLGVDPLLRYDSPSVAGFLVVGFNTFEVDGSTFRSEIDPLGQDLLLPFTTTPGISLGSGVAEGTPGGFNVVTDFQYRYNADQFSLYAKYGQRWACENGALTGYAGLAYTNLDQDQFARGDVTGFASDFRYNTRIEVDTWRAVAGLRYERELFHTPIGGLRGFVDVMGSLNFVDGEGRDAVDVSGFLNFAETQDIAKSDTTFGYGLGAGLVQHIDEAAMDIYIAYRHFGDETTPVVVRQDDGPSHLTFERSDYDMIIVGARVQF